MTGSEAIGWVALAALAGQTPVAPTATPVPGAPAATSAAIPTTAAPVPFAVMRAGDGQLSCDALIGEVNQLSADVADQQRRMASDAALADHHADRAQSAAEGASGLLSGLIPFGAGGIADEAIGHAAQAGRDAALHKSTATAIGKLPLFQLEQQRIEHLEQLAVAKQC